MIKFLPYLGVVAFLVGVYFWFQDVKQDAYDAGFKAAEAQVNERIAKEDADNRKREADLQATITSLLEKLSLARTEREVIYKGSDEKIIRYLNENPYNEQCNVSDNILEELNKIREQGPK